MRAKNRVGKPTWTVLQILEWAFCRECARLDLPDLREPEERGAGFGMEWLLIERARLGGVQIDTSRGVSEPHEDADRVAGVLLTLPDNVGGLWMALRMAEYARAGTVPDCMIGATPRLEPLEWKQGQGVGGARRRAKTKVIRIIKTTYRGREREHRVECCPAHWVPSHGEINAKREHYSDWIWSLRYLCATFKGMEFKAFDVADALPDPAPWKNENRIGIEHV